MYSHGTPFSICMLVFLLSRHAVASEPLEVQDFGDNQEVVQTNVDTVDCDYTDCSSISANETPHQKKPHGRRAKYPALLRLVLNNPNTTDIKYYTKNGTILAEVDDKSIPIYTTEEAMQFHASVSFNEGANDEPQHMSRYRLAKMKAEREGRLDEFMERYRAKVNAQRAKIKPEEKKALTKYNHIRRKMNREAFKLVNPEGAEKLEESRKAHIRKVSKERYHCHVEEERRRNKVKYIKSKLKKMQMSQEEVPASKVVHDFDLNDPAEYEDFGGEEDAELE